VAEKNYLVFDLGASNGRAVVARFDGERFTLEVTHRFDNRPVLAAGAFCWDLLRLYSEILAGIQKSLKACSRIESIGVDTWGVDFGFIDRKGRLLGNPRHYRDESRAAAAPGLLELLPARRLFDLTGMYVNPIFSIFGLRAMRTSAAPELAEADRFLMMADLFAFLLTGEALNEYTLATSTLAFNQVEGRWENRILDALEIPRGLFHAPVMPGTRIGSLQASVCRELEAPATPVIAPASHDTASAAAGVPWTGGGSWVFLSLGTWAVTGMETAAPVITDEVFAAGFGNEGGAEGTNLLITNSTGLWIMQQCREKWMREDGAEVSWDAVVSRCLEAPRLASLVDVDEPAFGAVQPDMGRVIVDACARTGQRVPSERGEIARCVYESLALKFRRRFEQLAGFTGRAIEVIRLVGGGTQNCALCQWTADATAIPVVAGPIETTVAGNLIMQLKGTGQVSSLAEGRRIVSVSCETRSYEPRDRDAWEEAYGRYRRLYP
jgi:rhamnulokinase